MLANRGRFYTGAGLITGFVIVLIVFFSPIFGDRNGLDYLDNLYNSISKNSANYFSKVRAACESIKQSRVNVVLTMADDRQAIQAVPLLKSDGVEAVHTGNMLTVTGDLGILLGNCLSDAEAMFYNNGEKVSSRYGYDERRVLYNWWQVLKQMEKALKAQKQFKAAATVSLVVNKAVEPSYNYYGIEPQRIGDRLGVVIFSLVSYVVYTLWYGYGIMYMFEGLGLRLGH